MTRRPLASAPAGLGALALALALGALGASPAAADASEDRGKAAAAFKQGQAYFQRGDFDRAIPEYQLAFDLSKEPSLIFNIALCHTRANRPEEALKFYKRYLEIAPDGDVSDEAREEVARLTPVVEQLAADREKKAAADREAEAKRKREREQREAWERANAPPSRIPLYIAAGGGAVVVAGFVTNILMWQTRSKLASASDPDVYIDERDTFKTRRTLAIAGYAVGAATVLTAGILRLTVFRRPDAPQLSAAIAPQGAMLTMEWSR